MRVNNSLPENKMTCAEEHFKSACHVCLKSRTTLLLNEKDTDSKYCSLLLRRSLGFEAGGEAIELLHRLLSKMIGKLDYILMSATKLISVPPSPLEYECAQCLMYSSELQFNVKLESLRYDYLQHLND